MGGRILPRLRVSKAYYYVHFVPQNEQGRLIGQAGRACKSELAHFFYLMQFIGNSSSENLRIMRMPKVILRSKRFRNFSRDICAVGEMKILVMYLYYIMLFDVVNYLVKKTMCYPYIHKSD